MQVFHPCLLLPKIVEIGMKEFISIAHHLNGGRDKICEKNIFFNVKKQSKFKKITHRNLHGFLIF